MRHYNAKQEVSCARNLGEDLPPTGNDRYTTETWNSEEPNTDCDFVLYICRIIQNQVLKTLFYVLNMVASNLLMLVAMTYNTWLFLAIVIGCGIGYFLVTPLYNSWYSTERRPLECHAGTDNTARELLAPSRTQEPDKDSG